MRSAFAVISTAALLSALAGAAEAPAAPSANSKVKLRLKQVASGFNSPVHLAAPKSEKRRLYVVEQAGVIWMVENGKRRPEPFLDIRSIVGSSGNEQGLLSIAFHPKYGKNRRLYVNYTDRSGNTRVVEYRSKGRQVLLNTRRQLLRVAQFASNHNGGQLAFGPDGFLYVGMGDGGGAGDPGNHGQNPKTRLGSLLKINVNNRRAKWTIVGYGLRNPWRFSFDREKGHLYIADVGQNAVEEINFTPKSSPGLENYGWDVFEGNARFESKPLNPTGKQVDPVATYTHSQGCSVTGGFVYRGKNLPAVRGRYFYGDFCSGTIWSLRVKNGVATMQRAERLRVSQLASFGEDGRGELYLVSRGGAIFKLIAGR